MVNLARRFLPRDILVDVICETRKCLADAIQLLTPCTPGNHWLRIVDTGRFSAVFNDKKKGDGVRVFLDVGKLKPFPAVDAWYLKRVPKSEQNLDAILDGLNEAGEALFSCYAVKVTPEILQVRPKVPPVICPVCGEAYPPYHGDLCRGCQGLKEKYYRRNSEAIS